MVIVAFLIGFRFEGSLLEAVYATLLLLFFSYSLSWMQAVIGLSVGSVEAANSAGFIWMFPLTFVSSAFVDTRQLAGADRPQQPIHRCHQRVSSAHNGLPVGTDAMVALAWSAGITVVFAAIAIRRFSRSTVA